MSTARKTPQKQPPGPDGEPLLELRTKGAKKAPVAMEPAFSLEGRVFSVPVEVKAQVAIRYMHYCRTEGENYGLSWLLEKVLGKDAYQALLEYEDLEDDQLIAISRIVQSKVLGDSTPKG